MASTQKTIFNPLKILVIGRVILHKQVHDLLDNSLTLFSYAETITEALDILPTLNVDFIVSETILPDSTVWQLAESLKSGLCASPPPVIALTNGNKTLALNKMAQSKSIYLFHEEYPYDGLVEYIAQMRKIRCQLFESKSVLVIEDDKRVVDSIYHVLESEFHLDWAGQGSEGLFKWKQYQHDLIILDIGLPDIDGLKILKLILAQDKHQPVLILTGNPSELNMKNSLLSGARSFLSKPIAPANLVKECYRALNWSDLERIHDQECACDETFRLVQAANELLQTGHLFESRTLLQKVEMQIDHVSPQDDDYF